MATSPSRKGLGLLLGAVCVLSQVIPSCTTLYRHIAFVILKCNCWPQLKIPFLTQVKADDSESPGPMKLPTSNLWPMEMQFGKVQSLGDVPGFTCINVPLDLEIDCPEAQTCGCESSILQVTSGGDQVLLRTRIDEISDVFEKDSVTTNLTLCEHKRSGDHGSSAWFSLEASLTHSHSEKVLSYSCRNISDEGKFKDCNYYPLAKKSGVEAAAVTVEKITFQSQDGHSQSKVCSKEGVCHNVPHADPEQLLDKGHDHRMHGDSDVAYQMYLAASAIEGEHRKPAHLHRLALLPPFALTGRCCDTANEHCKALRKEVPQFQLSEGEINLMSVFGEDQCEGFFVEVGAGDGVTTAATLFLEKLMGWNGLLIEGDPDSYKKLSTSGRSATYVNGELKAVDRPGLDLKEEIERHIDFDSPGGQVQLLVFNKIDLAALRSINFTEVSGYMGMSTPISQVIAVRADQATRTEVKAILKENRFEEFSDMGGGFEEVEEEEETTIRISGDAEEVKQIYDIYMYHPPMEMPEGDDMPEHDGPSDEGEEEGETEIEYHVTHDEEDDEEEED